MLYLLEPINAADPAWGCSSMTEPVQVYAPSLESARDLAATHLSKTMECGGNCAWRQESLCDGVLLSELLPDLPVIGEFGLVPGVRRK